jgi:MerR family transcriptional regulator/heat shock protein HspR
MSSPFDISDDTPVYVISVAAELSGLHPQTLRAYDRLGLVSPGRAAGRGRRYSVRDIGLLREVQRLSQEAGVNLAGIKRILELEGELDQYRRMLAEMTAQAAQLRAELESTRAVAARLAALLRRRAVRAELEPVRDPQPQPGGSRAPVIKIRPSLPAAARPEAAAEQASTEPARTGPSGAGPVPGVTPPAAPPAGTPGQLLTPRTTRIFESS